MGKVYISSKAKKRLSKTEGSSKKALLRLIKKSQNHKWFNNHIKLCKNTDLIILKQGNTAERIGCFINHKDLYIALVYAKHQLYEKDICNYKIANFPKRKFKLYKIK